MPVKKRGRPPVDSDRVETRMERDLLDGLDAYADAQDDKPTRPEAIRRIIRDWLQKAEYLKD